MKKTTIFISVMAVLVIGFISMNSDKRPSFDDVHIEDVVTISGESYEVISKERIEKVYENGTLVEMHMPDSDFITKYKYYYDNSNLVKEEQFKNEKINLIKNYTYVDDNLTEIASVSGNTLVSKQLIAQDKNNKTIRTENENGFASVTECLLDDNGNTLKCEVKNAKGLLEYSYYNKYEGNLLIEKSEERISGYKSTSQYGYNTNGDLIEQSTTVVEGSRTEYVTYIDYDYDENQNPILLKTFTLKKN